MIKPTPAYEANNGRLFSTEKEALKENIELLVSQVYYKRGNLSYGMYPSEVTGWLLKDWATIKKAVEEYNGNH